MKIEKQTTMRSGDTPSKHRDIFNERYHGFNKQLLCAVGLWPSRNFRGKRIRAVGLIIASFVVMTAQVRALMRGWGQFNFVVECITPIGMNVLGILKLANGLAHAPEIRKLCDQMQKDWDEMRYLPQINILEKCGEKGRRCTMFYFIMVYVIANCWMMVTFIPKVMDVLAPLNCSRRRFDIIPVDFMVDLDVYFYPIVIPMTIGIMYQLLVTVAMDTLYMVLAQHVCAMFEILRYNLHNVLHTHGTTGVILNPNIHEDMNYYEIISCIKKHKIIIEYIKNIESTCEWKLFVLLGMNMLSLSFTGYMVIVTRDYSVAMNTARYAVFSIGQIFHLFCNTLPGHWIMDSSSWIPHSAYGCRWYAMSMRSRKLILFLIRASVEPCNIIAGKLYIMSVENFSAVLRTSMSYLAMINSTR